MLSECITSKRSGRPRRLVWKYLSAKKGTAPRRGPDGSVGFRRGLTYAVGPEDYRRPRGDVVVHSEKDRPPRERNIKYARFYLDCDRRDYSCCCYDDAHASEPGRDKTEHRQCYYVATMIFSARKIFSVATPNSLSGIIYRFETASRQCV